MTYYNKQSVWKFAYSFGDAQIFFIYIPYILQTLHSTVPQNLELQGIWKAEEKNYGIFSVLMPEMLFFYYFFM